MSSRSTSTAERGAGYIVCSAERAAATPAIALLRLYRALLSPLLGPACRFAPSCSSYAEEALRRYGLIRGSVMAARRVLRCHPWHAGGWDPVA